MAANLASFLTSNSTVNETFDLRRPNSKLEPFKTFRQFVQSQLPAVTERSLSVAVPAHLVDDTPAIAKARSHSVPHLATDIAPTPSFTTVARPSEIECDTMASTTTPHNQSAPFAPFTPINKNVGTPNTMSKLRDSPFSDYFTDDGRSPESTPPSSPEKQQLLVRMKQLQVLLMQGEQEAERETLNIVERKISEIETQLSTMHSQTRMPPELEDSGLFMEDEDDEDGENVEDAFFEPPTPITILRHGEDTVPAVEEVKTAQQDQHDKLLAESQRVLHSVSKAQEQLRERCRELKALNDRHIAQMDSLRMENEALKSTLESNTSDLHFLHHKFRKLEIEVQALDAGAQRLETYAPQIREDIQRVKRKRMEEEMGRWEREWSSVAARRGSTREEGENVRGDGFVGVKSEAHEKVKGLGLEAVEKRGDDGKVNEVVVKRVESNENSKDQYRTPKIVGSYPRDSSSEDISSSHSEFEHVTTKSQDFSDSARARAMTATTASSYNDHLVLTATGSPVSQSLFDRDGEDTDEDDDDEREDKLKLDCAITTSSEDNVIPFSSNRSKREAKQGDSSGKTAWRELVDGLTALAGMGEW